MQSSGSLQSHGGVMSDRRQQLLCSLCSACRSECIASCRLAQHCPGCLARCSQLSGRSSLLSWALSKHCSRPQHALDAPRVDEEHDSHTHSDQHRGEGSALQRWTGQEEKQRTTSGRSRRDFEGIEKRCAQENQEF